MATALWAIVGVGLILLVATLFGLLTERGREPVWLVTAAVIAVVATAAVWYLAYRRRRYDGWDATVDAIGIFFVAATLESLPAAGGLLVVRTFLGSASSEPLAGKFAHSGIGFASMTGGLLVGAGPYGLPLLPMLLAGLGMVVITLVSSIFGTALSRDDHALAHKVVLFWTDHQFAGRLDPQRISEVTLAAAIHLAAQDLPGTKVRAAVAIGMEGRLEVTATSPSLEPAMGALLRFERGHLWPVHPEQPEAGVLTPLLDGSSSTALLLPIGARGAVRGALLFDAGKKVYPELRAALEWLCDSAGLALASAADTAELANLAFYDPLTRLPNRALLSEETDLALARASRSGTTAALLVLDLDGFKRINDGYGHHAGDEALVIVAARLRDQLRESDVAARLGGDEFAVLLNDLQEPAGATTVAERILTALNEPFELEEAQDRGLVIGASIGVVTWSPPPPPPGGAALEAGQRPGLDRLLQDADTAMYLAKSRGTGYEVVVKAPPPTGIEQPPPDHAPSG
jgi:diguanylate cyclase (GGDEF)-like protein